MLRGFSTSYCQFLPDPLLRWEKRKGSLERPPFARKLAKLLRSKHKDCMESWWVIIQSDNRTIASYFVLLTLPSIILAILLDKGKVVNKQTKKILFESIRYLYQVLRNNVFEMAWRNHVFLKCFRTTRQSIIYVWFYPSNQIILHVLHLSRYFSVSKETDIRLSEINMLKANFQCACTLVF